MTPFQRLEKIAEEEKRSVSQIVVLAGRHPSIISPLRNGKKNFTEELAKDIADKWDYNKEWILTGAGDMKAIKAPTGTGKTDFLMKQIRVAESFELIPILKTPLYARAGFGYVAYLNRPPEEQEWESIPVNKLYPGVEADDHTIVTVNGDSMEPVMQAGWEMLAYKLPDGEFPRVGKYVMLDYKDELIIKTLLAVNEEKKTITVQSYNNKEIKEIEMSEIRRVFHVYDYWKAFL